MNRLHALKRITPGHHHKTLDSAKWLSLARIFLLRQGHDLFYSLDLFIGELNAPEIDVNVVERNLMLYRQTGARHVVKHPLDIALDLIHRNLQLRDRINIGDKLNARLASHIHHLFHKAHIQQSLLRRHPLALAVDQNRVEIKNAMRFVQGGRRGKHGMIRRLGQLAAPVSLN